MSTPSRTTILKSPVAAAASVAYTGTAGSITQAVRGTCMRAWCTTDAFITVGTAATTANGTPVQAYETIWLPIPSNQSGTIGLNQGETPAVLISAIQITAGGTLFAQQFDE